MLLFAESFQSYSTPIQLLNRWEALVGGTNNQFISSAPLGSTARSLRLSMSSNQTQMGRITYRRLDATPVRIGFYLFLPAGQSGSQSIFSCGGINGTAVRTDYFFAVSAGGYVSAGLGTEASVVWTNTPIIVPGTWAWIEIIIDSTQVRVFVNGLLRLTVNGAVSLTSNVVFMAGSNAFSGAYFSNLVVYDTTGTTMNGGPYGPMFVEHKTPSGAGSSTQWTPLNPDIPNWDNVNDPGWGSGAGVESSVSGQKDLYAVEALTWSPYRVFGIQAMYQAMDSNSGGSSIEPILLLPAGEVTLPAQQLPVVSPEIFQVTVSESTPGVPLTVADINSMQLGMKSSMP